MMRVGVLVNPIAGLGGPAALKGSDDGWRQALDAGHEPTAGMRAQRFADTVKRHHSGGAVAWWTAPGALGLPAMDGASVVSMAESVLGETTAADTREAATLLAAEVDLLCFAGGDGTAADVAEAVGHSVPCLGIPAGVKITSPVFAYSPEDAGSLVASLAPGFATIPRDVTDLDEAAYREGRLAPALRGSLLVPASPVLQGGKSPMPVDVPLDPLVDDVLDGWDRDALVLVGAGSVCHAIKKRFWGKPTLLGVDAVRGDMIVATDLDAEGVGEIVAEAQAEGRDVQIVLSIIGGQGMLLGRGTQVLPPDVLRAVGWDAILVVAPHDKLLGLQGLHVDSGDPELDAAAPRHVRVRTGWNETRMLRVLRPN